MNSGEHSKFPRRNFLRGLSALGLWPLAGIRADASDLAEIPSINIFKNWPADDDPEYWPAIRRQFSFPPDEAYFNTGTLGACPVPVQEVMIDSMRDMEKSLPQCDYRDGSPECIAGYRPQLELRSKAGRVINASAVEIALVQNATMGINFIANGLDLQPGDEVLMTDQEHVGAVSPWELRAKRHGAVVKKLPIPIPTPDPQTVIDIFSAAIGPRTKVIAFPHVTSRHGIVMPARDLCQLARERNIFTLVDGAQAVGQLRVDVKKIECDAYACSPHKWLLAPPGNGLLYVREACQKQIWPTLAGERWNDYDAADGVFRLMQFGTANAALLIGLDAALDFYFRVGPEKIERRTLDLANRLRSQLQKTNGVTISSPLHPTLAGAIVTYGVDSIHGLELQDELWAQRKIRVREQGPQFVRQSVHYYNSPEEIEAALGVIKLLAAR